MRTTPLVLFLCVCVIAVLVWKLYKPFLAAPKQEVAPGEATLYFFYTEWCGFSQKAMPEWEKVRDALSSSGSVKAVGVDADADRKLVKLYGVEAYPTLLLETSDGLYQYEGKRTADAILTWVQDSTGFEVGKRL